MTAHRRKTCRTCGADKPIGKFYQHPTYADGYMNDCKACKVAYQAENDQLKAERIKERKRLWALRPENVAKRKVYAQSQRGREVHRECNRIYRAFKAATTQEHANGP